MTTTSPSKPAPTPAAQKQDAAPPVFLVDTREPIAGAYTFEGTVQRVKLDVGDYSLQGLQRVVAIERKTLDDLAQSIIKDRFWAEMARAEGMIRFVVLVEGTIADVRAQRYASRVHPNAILGAVVALAARKGFPTIWAGDRQHAAAFARDFLAACWDCRDALTEAPCLP